MRERRNKMKMNVSAEHGNGVSVQVRRTHSTSQQMQRVLKCHVFTLQVAEGVL